MPPGARQAIAIEAAGGAAGDMVVLRLLDPARDPPPRAAPTRAPHQGPAGAPNGRQWNARDRRAGPPGICGWHGMVWCAYQSGGMVWCAYQSGGIVWYGAWGVDRRAPRSTVIRIVAFRAKTTARGLNAPLSWNEERGVRCVGGHFQGRQVVCRFGQVRASLQFREGGRDAGAMRALAPRVAVRPL